MNPTIGSYQCFPIRSWGRRRGKKSKAKRERRSSAPVDSWANLYWSVCWFGRMRVGTHRFPNGLPSQNGELVALRKTAVNGGFHGIARTSTGKKDCLLLLAVAAGAASHSLTCLSCVKCYLVEFCLPLPSAPTQPAAVSVYPAAGDETERLPGARWKPVVRAWPNLVGREWRCGPPGLSDVGGVLVGRNMLPEVERLPGLRVVGGVLTLETSYLHAALERALSARYGIRRGC